MYRWRGGSMSVLGHKLSRKMPTADRIKNIDSRKKEKIDIDELLHSIKKKHPATYLPISAAERQKRTISFIPEPIDINENNQKLFFEVDPNFSKFSSQQEIKNNPEETHENQKEGKFTFSNCLIVDKIQDLVDEETQTGK